MNQPRKKPTPTPEQLAERAKSRALARKLVIAMAAACVILLGLDMLSKVDFSPVIDSFFGGEETSSIRFEYPDFEEDIMKDASYLSKIRLMAYTEGAQKTLINEDDYPNYNASINRMHTFFQTAIAGDLEGHNDCFTDAYHEDAGGERTEPFTMQRIYDMSIELIGESVSKEDQTRRTYYLVEYRIQKNNGTFRNDVGSDGALPQVFELFTDEAGVCLIDAVYDLGEFPGMENTDRS